jgi:cytochrome c oxidase assembly protein subunit 16
MIAECAIMIWVELSVLRNHGDETTPTTCPTHVVMNHFLKYGLPTIAFIVVASYGLAEFTSVKIQRRDERNRTLTADETLSFQKKVKNVQIENEFKSLQDKLDINTWENKRGPRPWEE